MVLDRITRLSHLLYQVSLDLCRIVNGAMAGEFTSVIWLAMIPKSLTSVFLTFVKWLLPAYSQACVPAGRRSQKAGSALKECAVCFC